MQTETDPVSRLWSAARAMFARMRAAIGEAAASALKQDFGAREARAIAAWLRPIEALVRRIVLIEAAALAREDHAHAPRCAPSAQRARPPAARPKTRAFRLWPRPSPHPARIRQLGPPVLLRDVWREQERAALVRRLAAARAMRRPAHVRMAERIEALARVLAHPAGAARRLARKLRAAPRLALQLASWKPPRGAGDPALHDAGRRAWSAALALNSS